VTEALEQFRREAQFQQPKLCLEASSINLTQQIEVDYAIQVQWRSYKVLTEVYTENMTSTWVADLEETLSMTTSEVATMRYQACEHQHKKQFVAFKRKLSS
jgi:hypothetical protein